MLTFKVGRRQVMNKLDIHDVAGLTRFVIGQGVVIAPDLRPDFTMSEFSFLTQCRLTSGQFCCCQVTAVNPTACFSVARLERR